MTGRSRGLCNARLVEKALFNYNSCLLPFELNNTD